MVVKITYFVHGTTTDNEQDICTGWKHGELSALGIEQSKALLGKLGGVTFDAIFTSDLKRAINSAKLTWGEDVELIIDPRLRECDYGAMNGTAFTDEEKEKHIDEPFSGDERFEGESYKDVERRMGVLVNDIRKAFDGKHIAIVAHQAPQLALEVICNAKTWQQAFAQDWRKRHAWQPGWVYEVR